MFYTLLGRLYFFSTIVVASFYFFIYLSFDYNRAIVKDELLKTAQMVSNQAVRSQAHLVKSTERFLKSLASLPQIQRPDSEICQDFVSHITPLFERYVNIGVPNEKGILTCNGTPLSGAVNVIDRDYIHEALTQHRFTTSALQIDRVVGEPTINFAYPVKYGSSSNHVIGVAVAVVSLGWWNELLSNSGLPAKSVGYILDHDNRAMALFPADTKFELPRNFDDILTGQDGVKRVFTQHQVLDSNGDVLLSFVTGVALDEALVHVNDHYMIIVIFFSALIFVVFILIRLFFIDAVDKPLKKLSGLVQKLGRNEDIGLVHPTGIKEMDVLQARFIEMAESKSQAEDRIVLQTQTDSLTGLTNRDAFNRALCEVFLSNKSNQKISIILIDLDNFKEVNDTRGHEVGDKVLKTIAFRLRHNIPSAQCLSRLGGDEFIFILEGDDTKEGNILALCEQAQMLIKQPIKLENDEIVMTSSLGVSIYPYDGEDVKTLMSAADQAMYHAKKSGRDTIRYFSKDLKDALLEKTELIKDLRQAITNQEFYLLYQPILNKHGDVIKFEALIRWQHPERGLIPPDRFIGFAEDSGQIIEIGHWVIQEAKRALESIRKVYGEDVQISVNVSPIQLSKYQGENGQLLKELLSQGVGQKNINKYNNLVVEITENLLMNSDESSRNALLAFRESGVQVALDDFGTGYSSLAYIMNYDIDYLKIDRSFVQKLGEESASQTLCEAIISMAHALGVEVIAEGIEAQTQADLLLGAGCDYLQGFYFSKPIPLDQVLIYQQDKII